MMLYFEKVSHKHNKTWPNFTVLRLCCSFLSETLKWGKHYGSKEQDMILLWVESFDSFKCLIGSSGWLLEQPRNCIAMC